MDRFDVRVYPRRSGKTTSLVEHLVKAEKDIEVALVLVLGGRFLYRKSYKGIT